MMPREHLLPNWIFTKGPGTPHCLHTAIKSQGLTPLKFLSHSCFSPQCCSLIHNLITLFFFPCIFAVTSKLVSMPPVFSCSLHPTHPCQIYLPKIKEELCRPLVPFCSVRGVGTKMNKTRSFPSGQCHGPSVDPSVEPPCKGHQEAMLLSPLCCDCWILGKS